MRYKIGAATRNQFLLVIGVGVLLSFPAFSNERDEALRCAQIPNKSERYACIDSVAERLQLQSGGGTDAQPSNEPVDPEPEEIVAPELGAEQLQPPSKAREKAVNQTVLIGLQKITYGQRGLASFHLANGQIWRQQELVRFSGGKSVKQVEIRRGSLGGYRLKLQGHRQFMRVRRVK